MDDYVTMPLRISAETVERIDDYWHEKRLKSRSVAMRELLELGLSRHSQGSQTDEPPTKQHVQQYKHEDQRKDHLHDQAERRGKG